MTEALGVTEARAVFFDVGNTLVYPHPSVSEVCRQVLEEAGHLRETELIDTFLPLVDAYYEDRYRADDTFWTSEEATSEVWVGMYSLLCRKLGIEQDAAALARRVYDEFGHASRWRHYDDVPLAFARLRTRGLHIGIISNWDSRLRGVIDGLGLGEYLDAVVCSAEVGLRKPDPRIFELACERVGVAPRDAVHVGDHHYADVLGAEAAGMVPVLIDRHGVGEAALVTGEARHAAYICTLDDLEEALGWEAR